MEMCGNYFSAEETLEEIITKKIIIEDKIPDEMPKYVKNEWANLTAEDMMKESMLKDAYNKMGMFGFVSWRWVDPLAKWIKNKKCLEVMAGRGWLSYALREKGVDIIATDNFSWHESKRYQKWNETVTDIEKLDAVESVEKYGHQIDVLIMSWAYMDDVAFQCIKKLHEVNPNAKVIYIGEGPGGCTANGNFFNHFEEITNDTEFNIASKNYQTWWGLHDDLLLGEYKD